MFEQGPAKQPLFEADPGIAGSTGADQASQQHKGGWEAYFAAHGGEPQPVDKVLADRVRRGYFSDDDIFTLGPPIPEDDSATSVDTDPAA